jgi:hypothetical protein
MKSKKGPRREAGGADRLLPEGIHAAARRLRPRPRRAARGGAALSRRPEAARRVRRGGEWPQEGSSEAARRAGAVPGEECRAHHRQARSPRPQCRLHLGADGIRFGFYRARPAAGRSPLDPYLRRRRRARSTIDLGAHESGAPPSQAPRREAWQSKGGEVRASRRCGTSEGRRRLRASCLAADRAPQATRHNRTGRAREGTIALAGEDLEWTGGMDRFDGASGHPARRADRGREAGEASGLAGC